MDVERTIAFLVENQARFDVKLAELGDKINLLVDRQIEAENRHEKAVVDSRKDMADLRSELRRAIHASVEEQRRERQRRHEMEDRLTVGMQQMQNGIRDLAAAQKVTEEKLQRFLDRG